MTEPAQQPGGPAERVAVVVVTFNRADLLRGMLVGLADQTRPPDLVVVVDNASTDHTSDVLTEAAALGLEGRLEPVRLEANTGGAGGFHVGLELAYERGYDRMWLMDDDVVPAPDCLETLLRHDAPGLMAVREDRAGRLVEKSALRFDLRNPLSIKPKRAMVETTYGTRAAMPETVALDVVAFEGFLVRRDVVEAIGLPERLFFIFYDDADYALRMRRAGFEVLAVRDAVLVRQLDFDQQHALDTWKGFYMYRNLFAVHRRHGANVWVRSVKPLAITAGVVALSPVRGGRGEARNVIRAWRASRNLDPPPDGPGVRG